jgi:hypothetical protein
MKFNEVLEIIVKSISTIDLGNKYYNVYFYERDDLDVRIEHKQSVDGDFSILGSVFDNIDISDKSKIEEIIIDEFEKEELDGVINLYNEIRAENFKFLVLKDLNLEKMFEIKKDEYDYYIILFKDTKIIGGKDGKHEFIRHYSHKELSLIHLLIALKDDLTMMGLQKAYNTTIALKMKFDESFD